MASGGVGCGVSFFVVLDVIWNPAELYDLGWHGLACQRYLLMVMLQISRTRWSLEGGWGLASFFHRFGCLGSCRSINLCGILREVGVPFFHCFGFSPADLSDDPSMDVL